VIASIADHGRGEGADRRGPPAREWAVARERAGVADGWGQDVSGGRGRVAMGRGREGECGRAREREGRSGPEAAQPRGAVFPFLFFSISYFLFLFLTSISFISFSFEQIIS
jgi:hypothetical protein